MGWTSDDDIPHKEALWQRLVSAYPQTGLWPIAIASAKAWDYQSPFGAEGWPRHWANPFQIPTDAFNSLDMDDRGGTDPEYYSRSDFIETVSCDLPWAPTLTLAPGTQLPTQPFAQLTAFRREPERIALVPCSRPSDAVMRLGFGIPNSDVTPGILTGVLRSWESRFGVVPALLDVGWTEFHVITPPTSITASRQLAEEIIALADDSWMQGGFNTVEGKVPMSAPDTMTRSHHWAIWWD